MHHCHRVTAAVVAVLSMMVVGGVAPTVAAVPTIAAGPAQASYDELLALFREFRSFQEPAVEDGVPDYSAAVMAEKFAQLRQFQRRLAAIDSSGWPISEQVDYHLVRAEMNGMEFQHRVLIS